VVTGDKSRDRGVIPKTLKVAVFEKWKREGGYVCCVCESVRVCRAGNGGRDAFVFKISVLSYALELLLLVHVSVNKSYPA